MSSREGPGGRRPMHLASGSPSRRLNPHFDKVHLKRIPPGITKLHFDKSY